MLIKMDERNYLIYIDETGRKGFAQEGFYKGSENLLEGTRILHRGLPEFARCAVEFICDLSNHEYTCFG